MSLLCQIYSTYWQRVWQCSMVHPLPVIFFFILLLIGTFHQLENALSLVTLRTMGWNTQANPAAIDLVLMMMADVYNFPTGMFLNVLQSTLNTVRVHVMKGCADICNQGVYFLFQMFLTMNYLFFSLIFNGTSLTFMLLLNLSLYFKDLWFYIHCKLTSSVRD